MPEKRKSHQVVVMDKDGKQLTPVRKKGRNASKSSKLETSKPPNAHLVLYKHISLPPLSIEIKIMLVN